VGFKLILLRMSEADVAAQANVVRQLKADKADKATVTAAVQRLLELKKAFAAANGGPPPATTNKEKKAQKKAQKKEARPAAAVTPPASDDPVAVQADIVRKLKADKADKTIIAAAVDKLLALKKEAGVNVAPPKKGAKTEKKVQEKPKKAAKQPSATAKPKPVAAAKPAPTAKPIQVYKQTTTSDVAWEPLVPVGHTAYSWEEDGESEDEAPAHKKALLGAGGKGCQSAASVAFHDARAAAKGALSPESTAQLLGSGPEPNFAAVWSSSAAVSSNWHTSKLLQLDSRGMLRWDGTHCKDSKGEPCSILQVAPAIAQGFVDQVAYAIETGVAGVSQGVHDRYVTFCNNKGLPLLNIGASYSDAVALLHGINCLPNKEVAVKMLQSSTASGNAQAMSLLGYCYQMGDGVEVNQKLAAELCLAAARKGDGFGMMRLARMYWTGAEGVMNKDVEKAKALNSHAVTLLEGILAAPTSSKVDRSRALSLLHSQPNMNA